MCRRKINHLHGKKIYEKTLLWPNCIKEEHVKFHFDPTLSTCKYVFKNEYFIYITHDNNTYYSPSHFNLDSLS